MQSVTHPEPAEKVRHLKGIIGTHKARRPAAVAPATTPVAPHAPNAPTGQALTG